jgi:prepilin-type N-terminal cleavage/methylation domain-containing protein
MLFRNHKRAFTLIELLVVIIIMAVMTCVVVPAYARFLQKARFDGVAQDIQDAFAFAKERAVANDTTVTLTFDPQSETFTVNVTPPPPPADQPTAMLIGSNGEEVSAAGSEAPMVVQLDPEYTITNFSTGGQAAVSGGGQNARQGNVAQINFLGDGTCDGASFSLSSSSGRTAQFILLPANGRLMIENSPAQNQ